jgi:hypothetical protein
MATVSSPSLEKAEVIDVEFLTLEARAARGSCLSILVSPGKAAPFSVARTSS